METNLLIELRNVTKVYGNGITTVRALNALSLQIKHHEFVSIVGASGSGKSTLLHILGLFDTPTSGEYLLDGLPTLNRNKDELALLRNTYIGFVFQRFLLLPYLTIFQNVMLPLEYHRQFPTDAEERVLEILNRVGLSEKKDFYPYQLSGGQQQRAAIARALVTKPQMVLADEPTGSLDSRTGEHIMELFSSLHDTMNTTIIIVTHDMQLAKKTHRQITVQDGKIVE